MVTVLPEESTACMTESYNTLIMSCLSSRRNAIYLPIDEILNATPRHPKSGTVIGVSREGRSVRAFRFGTGPRHVSLLGGCHADEPVGPWMLRRLAGHLMAAEETDPLKTSATWCIVPHANPDGEMRNRAWSEPEVRHPTPGAAVDPGRYLRGVVREGPGDDMEFGFPRPGPDPDLEARPENLAVAGFLRASAAVAGPFHLHVSFHGMAHAGGPWFLIDAAWQDRSRPLQERLVRNVESMGYVLHDVQRNGEKGFHRIARGFCTRPDSEAMARFFLDRGDDETAARFRPSSMEFVRSLGGDPLTLVSEMPLFLLAGVGETVEPTDPAAERFRNRTLPDIQRAAQEKSPDLESLLKTAGLTPMPIEEQMRLQLLFLEAGLNLL